MTAYSSFLIACPPPLTIRLHLLNDLNVERELVEAGVTISLCEASQTRSAPQEAGEVMCVGLGTRSCGGAGKLVEVGKAPQTNGRMGEAVKQLKYARITQSVDMVSF